MAVLAFNDYDSCIAAVMNGQHNLGSNTLKIAATNTAPNAATHTQLSDITEISAGNGYTAGGATLAISSSSQTGGAYTLVGGANVTFTASGGSIGPFRYLVLYDDTSASDLLISYYDHGSSVTLADGDSYVLNTNGATLLTGSIA